MTGWAIDMLLATTSLILIVLLIRRPVARLFGPQAAYALWLAPLVRLVVPPLPATSEVLTPNIAGGVPHYLLVAGIGDASRTLPVGAVLAAAWLAGAAIFLAVQWVRHSRFVADALANGRALDIEGVPYDVVASTLVEGPMATGLVHPLILVPSDFTEHFTPEQQQFALLHEQLHHRRGDIWAAAAALLLTSLHWFNPLVHMALRAFRRDMEAACDSSVVDRAGADAKPGYAETILRCAARPAPRSLCALTSIDELKGRLMMLKLNHGRMRRSLGLLLASALAAGGIATASVAHETGGETKEFVKKIEVHRVHGDKDVVVMDHDGEHSMALMHCDGEKFEADAGADSSAKKVQVKFMLCAKKGESLLAALEKAETDLQKRDEMPAEHKAQILAKVRAKIAELRAKG